MFFHSDDTRRLDRVWLAIPLVLLTAASCHKLDDDDCNLHGTCPDHLLRSYRDGISKECATCLETECHADVAACSTDYDCSRAAECELKQDPVLYQDCLAALLSQGSVEPNGPRGAWKGDTGSFGACRAQRCSDECLSRDVDWSCLCQYKSAPALKDITFVLSVHLFGVTFSPAAGVTVRVCNDSGCNEHGVTDADGVLKLDLGWTPATDLHFELMDEAEAPRFPNTLFYPGLIGGSGQQPVGLVVVSTEMVEAGNGELLGVAQVLSDAAQALVLPDTCRSPGTTSAVGVTLHTQAEGQDVPRCRNDRAVAPCVWYGRGESGFPDLNQTRTQGWGGGIVGLAQGKYHLRVCDAESTYLLARRQVEMRPGWMTIARTWPLTKDNGVGPETPCTSQTSSPSTPEASAN